MHLRRGDVAAVAILAVVLGVSCSDRDYPRDVATEGAARDEGSLDRYRELERLIDENLHLSAHLVMAVDGRTIRAVRAVLTPRDIPVLIDMLSDESERTAAAATSLLVTQGMDAVPALRAVPGKTRAAWRAREALERMQDCYDEGLWDVVSADSCPADREANRGRRLIDPERRKSQ